MVNNHAPTGPPGSTPQADRGTLVAGPRDMGKVMPKVLAETKDRADGKQVAGIVQALLKEKASA